MQGAQNGSALGLLTFSEKSTRSSPDNNGFHPIHCSGDVQLNVVVWILHIVQSTLGETSSLPGSPLKSLFQTLQCLLVNWMILISGQQ